MGWGGKDCLSFGIDREIDYIRYVNIMFFVTTSKNSVLFSNGTNLVAIQKTEYLI